ncbi:ABC transporter permease [Chelatococcus asaccharovorans]|uniref:NitT/TauT family transport system permease protein/sulfonate transport system permease protein n=1 Tax=Chelatococcus asaccharovorans TaxID=28210 RepID=A0A2V3UAW6_9HYPH|nr:ABC transporter permease [Chelatococcus asaccharovorans]MBS7703239.1 ABC transporter permease [Chelatococcus asaccharovorans]PXW61569.1 NitT/TauT family transport system permease protein/sulfonate transport system permease protein [Chelatococcus asaccharovorans]CAH1672471.1 NitT/TauT family transport system permease protein/sulfonate transport system permease protein [Chelatococcus asaccharovorans]CAH1676112.1 NitT/TauT family transport system permease protein/sulfonate transport system perm
MTDATRPIAQETRLARLTGKSAVSDFRLIALLVLGTVAANLALAETGFWRSLSFIAIPAGFVVLVVICERIGRHVRPARRAAYEKALAFGFPAAVLALWQIAGDTGMINTTWFPQPSRIAAGLWDMTIRYDKFSQTSLLGRPWLIPQAFSEGGFAGVWTLLSESHVLATVARVFIGFVLGAIPGILLGVVMGVNQTVRLMLDTTLSAIYVLPKIAIFPIVMLIFADPFGEGPKILVVALAVFILMTINTMAGVRGIDNVYLMAGRNYGAHGWQLMRHVILPGAMPVIFAGLRIALGTAMIVIISVEFLRAKQGVGFITFYYWEVLNPEKMYAGLVVVMLLGVLLTYLLQWLQRRLMPWQR